LDPSIVEALVRPVVPAGGLSPEEEELLSMVAEGKPIKAIAASRGVPPEAAEAEVEEVFVKLAEGVSAGSQSALRRLRMLQQAIVDREEQGETLSRLLPSRLAGQLNTHRAAMNHAILGEGGTVMQFVGDAVMAVFGAPFPQTDHADRAVAAASAMHGLQAEINGRWTAEG